MAVAFGWTEEYLEEQVVTLIKKGQIQARVDRQNKVSVTKCQDGLRRREAHTIGFCTVGFEGTHD